MIEFEDGNELEPEFVTSLEGRLDKELEPEAVDDLESESGEEPELEEAAILETRLDNEPELKLESNTDDELELEVVLFGNDGAAETPTRISGDTLRNNIFTAKNERLQNP